MTYESTPPFWQGVMFTLVILAILVFLIISFIMVRSGNKKAAWRRWLEALKVEKPFAEDLLDYFEAAIGIAEGYKDFFENPIAAPMTADNLYEFKQRMQDKVGDIINLIPIIRLYQIRRGQYTKWGDFGREVEQFRGELIHSGLMLESISSSEDEIKALRRMDTLRKLVPIVEKLRAYPGHHLGFDRLEKQLRCTLEETKANYAEIPIVPPTSDVEIRDLRNKWCRELAKHTIESLRRPNLPDDQRNTYSERLWYLIQLGNLVLGDLGETEKSLSELDPPPKTPISSVA